MIVRDEAPVIERCLISVLPYIDYWVIVDTGSKDNTPELIRSSLADIPGELHHREWINFGHNRTEALELARDKADYILVMDADNIFCADQCWQWPPLDADGYDLLLRSAGTEYRQRLLISNKKLWHWVGVLHEYLAADEAVTCLTLDGIWIDRRHEGARSRDPNTFRKDAAILETALELEPENERYVFYLGQSWRDAGELEKSLRAYRKRAAMGGWDEEVFFSLYQCGILLESLGRWPEALETYLKSWDYRPSRIEPLYRISKHYRTEGSYGLGFMFGTRAIRTPYPADSLFVDAEIYKWGVADEVSICAYYLGDYPTSFELCCQLLESQKTPECERKRIETNRDFSVPFILSSTATYPEDAVAIETNPSLNGPKITLTVTACKRLELFKKTINSFLNCCLDKELIARWICIDDGSSEEDRLEMQRLYPFFEFIFKEPQEKGHASSMNRLLSEIDTPYWLALEDDWHFFVKANYCQKMLSVLEEDESLGQVLFNRNYGLTLENRDLVGGVQKLTSDSSSRYIEHQHFPSDSEDYQRLMEKLAPGALSNAWWPNYSLQPSMASMRSIKAIGSYNEETKHFELEFAKRYTDKGYHTAFLDGIHALHIGKQPWETNPEVKNAYELNDHPQFI